MPSHHGHANLIWPLQPEALRERADDGLGECCTARDVPDDLNNDKSEATRRWVRMVPTSGSAKAVDQFVKAANEVLEDQNVNYLAIIASLLISPWTERKPTKRTFEMPCFYFSGMADGR